MSEDKSTELEAAFARIRTSTVDVIVAISDLRAEFEKLHRAITAIKKPHNETSER